MACNVFSNIFRESAAAFSERRVSVTFKEGRTFTVMDKHRPRIPFPTSTQIPDQIIHKKVRDDSPSNRRGLVRCQLYGKTRHLFWLSNIFVSAYIKEVLEFRFRGIKCSFITNMPKHIFLKFEVIKFWIRSIKWARNNLMEKFFFKTSGNMDKKFRWRVPLQGKFPFPNSERVFDCAGSDAGSWRKSSLCKAWRTS